MLVKCPNCLKRYKVNTSRVSKALIKVKCPACTQEVVLKLEKKLHPDTEYKTNQQPLNPGDVLSPTSIRRLGDLLTITVDGVRQSPFILIADEPRAFRNFLRKCLEELGCIVVTVDDGSAVEEVLKRGERPHVIFLNVVLKHTMGFILCDKIKNDPELSGIRIVLIGAIFRIDRFRRDPSSLYGADDYIEEIIVKQDLQDRMRKLLGAPLIEETGAEPDVPQDVIGHARRLARIILSDIVLYNKEKVDQWIIEDQFRSELQKEIREGEEYYHSKIPSDRPEVSEIYHQTIEDYLVRRKRELSKI